MKYRIGWEHPSVKSMWSERILAADEHAVIITGPCPPFAFGQAIAVCPDKRTAELVVQALNFYMEYQK